MLALAKWHHCYHMSWTSLSERDVMNSSERRHNWIWGHLPNFNVNNWERRHFPIRVALQLTVKWFLTLKSLKKVTSLPIWMGDNFWQWHIISHYKLMVINWEWRHFPSKRHHIWQWPHYITWSSLRVTFLRIRDTSQLAVTSLLQCNVINWEWRVTTDCDVIT